MASHPPFFSGKRETPPTPWTPRDSSSGRIEHVFQESPRIIEDEGLTTPPRGIAQRYVEGPSRGAAEGWSPEDRGGKSEDEDVGGFPLDFVQLAPSSPALPAASPPVGRFVSPNLHSSRESMKMGMDPNLTVLVYENGMGVYIHKLFAEKHRITPGTEVHPSLLLKHETEIPMEERTKMQSWIHPDDRKYLETRPFDPVFWGHIDPPIQSSRG